MSTWEIIKKATKAGVAGPRDWIVLHYFAFNNTTGDVVFNTRAAGSPILVTNYGEGELVEGL